MKKSKLRSIKIKSRLIISFAVILLIPIITMSLYSVSFSGGAIKSNVSTYSSIEMDLISKSIDNKLSTYKTDILAVTFASAFQEKLSTFDDLDDTKKTEITNSMNQIDIKKYIEDKSVSAVVILDKDGILVAGKGYDEVYAKKIIGANEESDKSHSFKIVNASKDSKNPLYEIGYSSPIINVKYGTVIGYFWININEDDIFNMYKDSIKGNDGLVMVTDSNGVVFSSKNKADIGKKYNDDNLIKFATTSKISDSLNVGNSNYFVTSKGIGSYGLFLVSMISNSYLNQSASIIKISIIGIGIVIFLLAIIVSLVISNTISSPLKRLMQSIEEAKEGKIKASQAKITEDEVGEVTLSFNEMMVSLSTLIGNTKGNSSEILDSIEAITEVAEQSYAASEEIAATMNEVAKGAGVQAEGMANTVSYLNNLDDAIKNVELSLKETLKVLDDTEDMGKETKVAIKFLEEKSKDTRTVTGRISDNIIELNSYMGEIQDVTKLIAAVSEQTNLLSLNAAIEAARTGDAGKGFTIVSAEVKKLAIQTRAASVKISSIISDLTAKISRITENVAKSQNVINKQDEAISETEVSVSSIINSMVEVIGSIGGVIVSIKDISILKEETCYAIEGISAVSQETAAITEQVTATTIEQIIDTENLSQASSTLNEMVKKLNNAMEMFTV